MATVAQGTPIFTTFSHPRALSGGKSDTLESCGYHSDLLHSPEGVCRGGGRLKPERRCEKREKACLSLSAPLGFAQVGVVVLILADLVRNAQDARLGKGRPRKWLPPCKAADILPHSRAARSIWPVFSLLQPPSCTTLRERGRWEGGVSPAAAGLPRLISPWHIAAECPPGPSTGAPLARALFQPSH